MGIGKILLELMNEQNTNANELAKTINVSPNTLYSIIRRDNLKVDIDVLIKVSDALGVPAEYFYDKRKSSTQEKFTFLETQHIKKYRQLDADGKERIDAMLDTEVAQLKRKDETQSKETAM